MRVLSKGAPEILKNFFKEEPAGYKENYIGFVKKGARVLAMAYKDLSGSIE